MDEDEWLRSAWEEGLIKEDEDPKVYGERTSKSKMKEWQSKPMHGQFQDGPKTCPAMILGNGFREGSSRKRQRG